MLQTFMFFTINASFPTVCDCASIFLQPHVFKNKQRAAVNSFNLKPLLSLMDFMAKSN